MGLVVGVDDEQRTRSNHRGHVEWSGQDAELRWRIKRELRWRSAVEKMVCKPSKKSDYPW